jgi:hypothetical protein
MQGANRPNTADVLMQLMAIIQFKFNFRKKVSANMELLRAKAGCMHSYGINIGPTQLTLILLANVDVAASENWDHEFCPALQTIRRHFMYNHTHDNASISTILTKLAGANSVRNPRALPMQSTTKSLSSLTSFNNRQSTPVQSPPNMHLPCILTPILSPITIPTTIATAATAWGTTNAAALATWPQPLPTLKAFKLRKPHPRINEDKCFWNKKYKGYRAKWIFDEIELKYKPRHRFAADMGGYQEDSASKTE